MPGFFEKYEKVISGVVGVLTFCSVFIAAWQLRQASKQIEASTIYQIQKDGRQLLGSLNQDSSIFNYIYKYKDGTKYNQDVVSRAERKIVELTQYFSSVFNQRRNGIISDPYWTTFNEEICHFFRIRPDTRFWEERGKSGQYSDDFKTLIRSCLN